MTQNWTRLLFALATTELMHNAIEIWGMRQKVEWLTARIDNRQHGQWPVNIDTRVKTALLHGLIFIVTTSLAWAVAAWLHLTHSQLVISAIALLTLNYISTTITVDRFHREIGKLLRRFKNN